MAEDPQKQKIVSGEDVSEMGLAPTASISIRSVPQRELTDEMLISLC